MDDHREKRRFFSLYSSLYLLVTGDYPLWSLVTTLSAFVNKKLTTYER